MRPERQSRTLLAITRAKEKMYEFRVPREDHIVIPEGVDPSKLFFFAIASLGDYAARLAAARNVGEAADPTGEGLRFSAKFFDAFVGSRLNSSLADDTALLVAAAYYLLEQPGSSVVAVRDVPDRPEDNALKRILKWMLRSPYDDPPPIGGFFALESQTLGHALREALSLGGLDDAVDQAAADLRRVAYASGTAEELLLADLVVAVARLRVSFSSWSRLPDYSGVARVEWEPAIRKGAIPRELWPSQRRLGEFGVFAGRSAVVQMPTSAGKSRSIEILIRAAFMAGRASTAVIVAPFRALSREIGSSLQEAFRGENVRVNEVPDVLQMDFQLEQPQASGAVSQANILVVTPEKLLYLLRNTEGLVESLGLVVYDEGHQFDSGARGVTYELLLSEIKALLPTVAQSVLISAVIPNGGRIGEWLLGPDAAVISGTGLLPTSRAVAFTSWRERRGQLQVFDNGEYREPDYFVPRVIEQSQLALRGRERATRLFPERGDSGAIALYLGLRLCGNGAVAVFCGRKDTASRIAALAVDVFERGFDEKQPGELVQSSEGERLANLLASHFGRESPQAKAARIGVFVHHGATPHGVRLAVEFAMQRGLIRFVICTSTLAQGVNLPIRYLVIPGIQQGGERISVRDFQNLVGRAGRAGMHREGTVLFAHPQAFDLRADRKKGWEFAASVELLTPANAENIGSSLLEVFAPIRPRPFRRGIAVEPFALVDILLSEGDWASWAAGVLSAVAGTDLTEQELLSQLRRRRDLLRSVESHLMAKRGEVAPEEFVEFAERLAASTLAHHLAEGSEQAGLAYLFRRLAEHVVAIQGTPDKVASFGKTLLGVADAQRIDSWTEENEAEIPALITPEAWLSALMPLFRERILRPLFVGVQPERFASALATGWASGAPYSDLMQGAIAVGASKPHGDERRRVTDQDIAEYCENDFGYSCGLVIAAVKRFVGDRYPEQEASSTALGVLQKRLRYGVADGLAISFFEAGFADRVVAQELAVVAHELAPEVPDARVACRILRSRLEEILRPFPAYFADVLRQIS